jgi:hypothetical protein
MTVYVVATGLAALVLVGRVGAVNRGHLVLGGAGLTRVARKGASAEGLMVLRAQFQDVHVAPQASPTKWFHLFVVC